VIHYSFSKLDTLRIKTNLFKPLIQKYYDNEQCLSFTKDACDITILLNRQIIYKSKRLLPEKASLWKCLVLFKLTTQVYFLF